MNGYELMAQSFQKLADRDEVTQEYADKKIRIYDFLSKCDKEDICAMVDSSAFNDVIRGYMYAVVNNADIPKKAKEQLVKSCFRILDEMSAEDVLI